MTHWIITVVDKKRNWRYATAASLVREMGLPPKTAARWQAERRAMSPAGLKRKLKGSAN